MNNKSTDLSCIATLHVAAFDNANNNTTLIWMPRLKSRHSLRWQPSIPRYHDVPASTSGSDFYTQHAEGMGINLAYSNRASGTDTV